MEQNHFSKTGKGSSKEHSGEIILKLAHWPKRRCRLKGFSIFSSDVHFVQWNHFSNFGRGSSEENFY